MNEKIYCLRLLSRREVSAGEDDDGDLAFKRYRVDGGMAMDEGDSGRRRVDCGCLENNGGSKNGLIPFFMSISISELTNYII